MRRAMLLPGLLSLSLAALLAVAPRSASADALGEWKPEPADWKGASLDGASATLIADKWSYLRSPEEFMDVELAATLTILQTAKTAAFFGQSWSVWPDRTFGDGGFEAALFLHANAESGYRVQFSHKYQSVALVKCPEGGYVQVVPVAVKANQPHQARARAQGGTITVEFDGAEVIRWRDTFLPLKGGSAGIGASSGAKARFSDVRATSLPAVTAGPIPAHAPKFSVREFLGGRPWIFDGDEPIMLLPVPKANSVNNVKLRPGYKPQLSFNSHWDVANQGAYKEAANTNGPTTWSGGGASLSASWTTQHKDGAFGTKTTLTAGWDEKRQVYTYDVESAMEVSREFHFRYGFDFEHHTPLDPFRWQYLMARRKDGTVYHRPVGPFDPGPQEDLETSGGARVWFGRHGEKMHIAPAVEYHISPGDSAGRKLNTAVCAAFYDTGVSFPAETAKAGARIAVNYRYTGWPAAEAEALFAQSKIYTAPTLDPEHHFIFADEWPKLTFSDYVPLSETWIYGRTPFLSGHNQRPSYELEKHCGAGSGHAMKLGPASFAKAPLPKAAPLAKGRYVVTALVKAVNVHGPGGRMELEVTQAKTNQKLTGARHYFGSGTFDWQRQGFAFDVPEDAGTLTVAFGNAGTGEVLVTDVEFRKLGADEPLPDGISAAPRDQPARSAESLPGAVADYRMEEGKGNVVLNHGSSAQLGHLELANLDWVEDSGHRALRFAENAAGRKNYRPDSRLSRNYLNHSGYAGKDTVPAAIAGHHGGGERLPGLTLAAWVKPAAEMGKGGHGGKGDVAGYGARRFILGLHGQNAPYQLTARVNVNDVFTAPDAIEADRWHHLALTAKPEDAHWRVSLFLNGRQVADGRTAKFPADTIIPPSLILGAEIFYLHDAYYRGLIGRTLVLHRAATQEEIEKLASPAKPPLPPSEVRPPPR